MIDLKNNLLRTKYTYIKARIVTDIKMSAIKRTEHAR